MTLESNAVLYVWKCSLDIASLGLTENSSLQCTVDKFVSIARAGPGQLIMGYISKPLEGLIIGYL